MEYFGQHNGKGKTHLLNDDFEVLCGSKGDFNFSDTYNFYVKFKGKYGSGNFPTQKLKKI